MSKEIEARLRALEKRQHSTEWWANLKPVLPLAGMSETWQEQYHKDPKILEDIWHDTVRDYHQKHIDEWRKNPSKYADKDGNISSIPPWYRLVPHDDSEWYKELVQDAETSLVLWQALGGGRKEALNDDD